MSSKKRIGELLIEAGVIDESMLQSALGHQRRWGGRIGQALLDMKLITEAALVDALARKSGFEVARLAELEPYAFEQAKGLVPRDFAQRNNVFPLAADTSTITVAMGDPTNLALTDELRFRTGRRVRVCIGGDREIAEAIRTHYGVEGEQAPEAIALDLEPTGDGVQLADPFEGGTSDDMRAMLEPTWQAATVAPSRYPAAPPAAAQAVVPAPAPPPVAPVAPAPAAPVAPVAPRPTQAAFVPPAAARPAAPVAPRPAAPAAPVAPRPAPPAAAPAAPVAPRPAAPAAPRHPTTATQAPGPAPAAVAPRPATFVPPAPVPAPRPVPTRTGLPAVAAPSAAAPAPPRPATQAVPAAAPPGTSLPPLVAPAAAVAPHAPPAPAAAPAPAASARPAPAAAPAAAPRPASAPPPAPPPPAPPPGGTEDRLEELVPSLDDEEPVLATDLAPEDEMVEGRVAVRELSSRDVAILDALERLAMGVEDPASPVKPAQVAAALLRLMLRKKLVSEQELLDELTRR